MSNGSRQCQVCRQNATFVQEHNRWFCENCKRYLPRDAPPAQSYQPPGTAPPPPEQEFGEDLLLKKEVDKIFRKIGISGQIAAIVMVAFGIIVILFPDLISWLIGIFLIIIGVIAFIGTMPKRPARPHYHPPPQEHRRYPPPSD